MLAFHLLYHNLEEGRRTRIDVGMSASPDLKNTMRPNLAILLLNRVWASLAPAQASESGFRDVCAISERFQGLITSAMAARPEATHSLVPTVLRTDISDPEPRKLVRDPCRPCELDCASQSERHTVRACLREIALRKLVS